VICLHWWALAVLLLLATIGVFFVAFVLHTWFLFR
jgi:hypothetical protein